MESSRLQYTRLGQDHFLDYKSWYSNDEVMRHITGSSLSEEAIQLRFTKALEVNNAVDPSIGWFLTYLRISNEFVGIAKLTPVPDHADCLEIGYGSLPGFWMQGYGNEMLDRMLTVAHSLPTVRSIVGIVAIDNGPSIHMLKSRGFEIESKSDGAYKLVRLVNS